MSEWVSDYYLSPKWAFFRHIMARANYIQSDDVHFVLDQHADCLLKQKSRG
jgi:hypothetical protein